jgi:glycosyltransferase involved in cell wall biosynthesis
MKQLRICELLPMPKISNSLPLTIVIPILNEEVVLPRALISAKRLGVEVFILDSGSTDRSLEIAKEFGCQVTVGQWGSFSEKLNFGLNHLPIKTEWVMRLDADEYLTDEFIVNIRPLLDSVSLGVEGIIVRRRFVFLNKWIKHGGMYPLEHMRITRKGRATYEARILDEHVSVPGEVIRMTGDIVDEDQKGLVNWLSKHVRYAEAQCYMDWNTSSMNEKSWKNLEGGLKWRRFLKEEVYARSPVFIRPFGFWFYRYILLLGFLDGKPGFIWHFLHAFWYRFSIDTLVYEAQITKGESVKKSHTC